MPSIVGDEATMDRNGVAQMTLSLKGFKMGYQAEVLSIATLQKSSGHEMIIDLRAPYDIEFVRVSQAFQSKQYLMPICTLIQSDTETTCNFRVEYILIEAPYYRWNRSRRRRKAARGTRSSTSS